MERNHLQPNNTYNASLAPNAAYAGGQQQGAPSEGEPVPPLANAPDLNAHPPARNLQAYNAIRTPQRWVDSWSLPEYQPIQPGKPYLEKLVDEAMNTKKLNICLKNALENEELGDFKDAEKAYKRALKYTDNAEHYKLYAVCLSKLSTSSKDEAKEITYREKAARAFYYLGELYAKQGSWNPAQAAYKTSCELALYEVPLKALVAVARQLGEARELADALEQLADFYAEKGDTASAIQMLEEALQVEKSSTILEKLAALHAQIGGEDSQLKVNETRIHQFELQISQDPKNIGLYRQYVWFLKDIGQRNAARAVKERMDGLYQANSENLNRLEQKLVKQKTRIRELKQTIHLQDEKIHLQARELQTVGHQLECLNRQAIHLDFSHCPAMQDADFIPLLIHNPYVQSLNLAGCERLTDTVLHILPERFENLKELNLSGCKGLKAAGLNTIVENATQLRRLILDHCPGTTIRLLHKLNAKGIAFTIEGVPLSSKPCLDLSIQKDTLTDADLLKALQENPEITKLNLSGCSKITDAGLAPLQNFQWLTYLNLNYGSQFTDIALQHLSGLTQLTHLYWYNCNQLTDTGLQHLAGLTRLTNLDLRLSQATDVGLRHLAGLTRLTTLALNYCKQFTDAGLQHLAGLTQLTTLNLSGCDQITDAGLQHLAGLSQLTSLSLYGCNKITDTGLQYLAGLTGLTSLNLYNCNQLTDAGLQHLAGLTGLTSLNLHNCTQLTDAGLQYLSGLTQLKELFLHNCKKLSDAGLQHLRGLTQLTDLTFSHCPQLTDKSLQHLVGLTQLKSLNLGHSNQFTDEGLQQLKGFTQLTQLSLYGCTQLTDAHLQRLAGFTQLTSLNLCNCNQLTDAGLQHLAGLTQLKTLDLRGTKVTPEAKEQLKKQIPGLTITG